MLCFRLSSALLLAAVCCLHATAERVTTCDGNPASVHRLSCDVTASAVIRVQSAQYRCTDCGTDNAGRFAEGLFSTECPQEDTLRILQSRCNGKRVCELNANVFQSSAACPGTYRYLYTIYTCLPAIHVISCEHSAAHLYCDLGQIIVIHSADYGRHDRTTCSYKRPASQLQNVYCSRPTKKVAESCNGRNSCTIYASNSVFGDPCHGTYKYLELIYTCQYSLRSCCLAGTACLNKV